MGGLFLPWRTGEGRLFTLEHFQNVRRSLTQGGLFCQWLPLFQLRRPQLEAIARTFYEVFPDAFLVRGDFSSELPILGLVGGREPTQINWRRVEPGCARIRQIGNVTDPLVRHGEGVAHDSGQFFLTLEIAAKLNLPVVEDLKSQASGRTPATLRADKQADWRRWPMRVKPPQQSN